MKTQGGERRGEAGRGADGRAILAQAVALGLIQGPTELLPVSSSAHLFLVPWMLRWRYADLDPSLRKTFEVAVHGGTALALLTSPQWRAALDPRGSAGDAGALVLAIVPSAVAGLLFERAVARRLGTPEAMAIGLAAGSAAMIAGDARPEQRSRQSLDACDGIALGVAQVTALHPGVSRMGVTLAAARARAFDRPAAAAISRRIGMPVLCGAACLKATRMLRHGVPPMSRSMIAVGFGAAFVSTVAAERCLGRAADRSPLPFALYRVGVALATVALLRKRSRELPSDAPDVPPGRHAGEVRSFA